MCWKNDVYRGTSKAINVSLKCAPLALPLLIPTFAFAADKVSDLTGSWKGEAKEIIPVLLLIVAAFGVVTAGVAVLSGITAKRNSRPLEWQTWGFVGGALTAVIPTMILAFSGSLSGGKGNAGAVLGDLGL